MHTGKLFFYFSTKTYVVGTQKNNVSMRWFFEYPKHMFEMLGKEINATLGAPDTLIWTYEPWGQATISLLATNGVLLAG